MPRKTPTTPEALPIQRNLTVGYWSDRPGSRLTLKLEVQVRRAEKGPELSICGTLWDSRVRNDCVSAGQNCKDLRRLLTASKATLKLPRATLERLAAIWDTWHLNGMNAGCGHQRALGWGSTKLPDGRWSGHVKPEEHPDGVLCKPCPTCGYGYGTAWLYEPLPADVVEFVEALPVEA